MPDEAVLEAPIRDLQSVFAERVKQEHDIIAHRMTWLMTLNSFLIAGGAVLVANKDKFDDSYGLSIGIFAITLLGALSNTSVLFSNYWATRAIREAGDALRTSWANLPREEQDQQRAEMRLFGRDPKSFRGPSRGAPSQFLHPWLFLPGIFSLFYVFVQYFASDISSKDSDLLPEAMLITVLLLGLFVFWPLYDIRFHNRRRVLAYVVELKGLKSWPRFRERRRRYRDMKREVRVWIDSQPWQENEKPRAKRLGLIPRGTFDKYEADHPLPDSAHADDPIGTSAPEPPSG